MRFSTMDLMIAVVPKANVPDPDPCLGVTVHCPRISAEPCVVSKPCETPSQAPPAIRNDRADLIAIRAELREVLKQLEEREEIAKRDTVGV